MPSLIEKTIRDIPDFPKPGILFKDITPVLSNPEAFKRSIDLLVEAFEDKGISKIIGIESRGFIFGAPLAQRLGLGFIPIRKPGKLPAKVISESYELEYGTDTLEIHEDAIEKGEKVLVVDDLLATGGTAQAAAKLLEKVGADIVGFAFIIELSFLNGKEKLQSHHVHSLLTY